MIVVYCCNFAPLNVRISRTNVVSLQENIYPWANPQYETWWNHPQFIVGKQLPNLGRFDDPLLPSGKVPLLQQTMKLATSGVFKAIYEQSENNRLLAVVFNCKHQSFIACKFSNRCFFVQLCTGNVRRTSRAFQRLGPCLLSSWQHQDLVQKDGGLYSTLMYVDDGGTPTWFPKSWGYPQIIHFNRIFMEVMMMMMVMILITTLKIILLLLLIWMLMLMVVVMMTSKDCLAMTLIKWVWLKLIHTATLVCGSNGILGRQTQNKSNAIFVIFRYWSPFQAPNYILQVHIFTHMFYTSLYEHLIVHSIYIYVYIYFSASYLHHLKSSDMQYRMI